MRFFTGCLVSAILASLLTNWMLSAGPGSRLVAQEAARAASTGPAFPTKAADLDPAVDPAVDLDGLSAEEQIAVAVYERANRSVVNITTKTIRTDGFFVLEEAEEGTGSGIVIDRAGHVLTNFHVLEGAREVAVTMFNGKTYDAEYVGSDAINDVAVIRINAPDDVLFPVTLGESNSLKVGMRVFAIGNPFGLERTMTTGIISSLNRSLAVRANRTIRSIIQIDAAVNPGNSGGPLLDSHGRLIGINTAIASRTGQSAGVGFAIPVNLVKRVVPQLLKYGKVIRPEIGIQRVYETENGLLVARLTPGGPAERAGLKGPTRQRRGLFVVVDRSAADLITAVDGMEMNTADDFLSYIEGRKAGDSVVLSVIRAGRKIEISVELGGSE